MTRHNLGTENIAVLEQSLSLTGTAREAEASCLFEQWHSCNNDVDACFLTHNFKSKHLLINIDRERESCNVNYLGLPPLNLGCFAFAKVKRSK